MYWKPDRLTLVRQRPFDRLLDPPSTIRTQLATLCRVKAFDGLHQTKVSFRNQIEEREPKIRGVLSDLNDKPEVRFDLIQARAFWSPFFMRAASSISCCAVSNGVCMIS